MSTDPRFKCCQCEKYKLPDEYGTRQRDDRHGPKDDRLSRCLSCSAVNSDSRKRKRIESNPDHPAKRLATQPSASPSQFMEALAKHASAAEIEDSWRVSVDEMTLADKEIANHLASLAWKATGYRFSFHNSRTIAGGSFTRFTYQCCQARGTTNDMPKRSTVGEEKQRIARRMERFDCHGRLHVALHNGVAIVDIAHRQSHKSYGRIDPSQHSSPLTEPQSLVFSPQEGYSTGTDGLPYESESDGFTEPLSLDELREKIEKRLLMALDLLRSRRAHMDPEWLAKFNESAEPLFKFVRDTIRDQTRRTLPKSK